ncbi:MAG: hypothetical protein WCS93_06695 [Candidatus Delongbacteria bacterium]
MDQQKYQISYFLKLISCILFDIVFVYFFYRLLIFPSLLLPDKTAMIFIFTIISLLIFNISIILSKNVVSYIGIPYAILLYLSLFAYFIVTIVTSVVFIASPVLSLLFAHVFSIAILSAVFSLIIYFGRKSEKSLESCQIKKGESSEIENLIFEIEDILINLDNLSAKSINNEFTLLRERFFASSPIGKVKNSESFEYQNKILDGFKSIRADLSGNIESQETEKIISKIKLLITTIKRRETNIFL